MRHGFSIRGCLARYHTAVKTERLVMRKSTMCKVVTPHHGEQISVENNGDIRCFKTFKEAYDYATDPIDAEVLGEIELIEVNGAAPGPQSPGRHNPDDLDEIATDLWVRQPFKGN